MKTFSRSLPSIMKHDNFIVHTTATMNDSLKISVYLEFMTVKKVVVVQLLLLVVMMRRKMEGCFNRMPEIGYITHATKRFARFKMSLSLSRAAPLTQYLSPLTQHSHLLP
jgi:hypothetical protein